MTDTTSKVGRLAFLSEDDKGRVYDAALTILADIGMRVHHDEGRAIMLAAGCTLDDDQRVHVPRELVARARETAPASFILHDRAGAPAFTVGGYAAVFGTGSDLMHLYDLESGERRRTSLADVATCARLCDALDNIDFVMSSAYPHEVESHRAYLEEFRAMVLGTTKPLVMTAEGGRDLERMWAAACELRGGPEELRAQAVLRRLRPAEQPAGPPDGQRRQAALLRRRRHPRDLLPRPPGRRHRADHRGRARGARRRRVALRPRAAPARAGRDPRSSRGWARPSSTWPPPSPPTTPRSTCRPTPASSRWRAGWTCRTGATAARPTRSSSTRKPAWRSPS